MTLTTKGRPTTQTFDIGGQTAFHCYRKKEVQIPSVPGSSPPKPSLLLFDLENKANKGTDGYDYIHNSQQVAPIALYGTSGAGKTRTIFEYLSHNYGFYLNPGADHLFNPGSQDVIALLNLWEQMVQPIPSGKGISSKEKAKVGAANIALVVKPLQALIELRKAVFNHINAMLDGNLTCHQWLLVQLFPEHFLGTDVFQDLFLELKDKKFDYDWIDSHKIEMSCFLDEAQGLLKRMGNFFCSSNGEEERSAYYACLQGLTKLQSFKIIHYPCFSGTGMSLEDYKAQMASLLNKPQLKEHQFFFARLKTMNSGDVTEYLKKFLDLHSVGKDLVEHVGKWLTGRPRWAATFIETYLEKPQTRKHNINGDFRPPEVPLIMALNRYIEICSCPNTESPRDSWTLEERSAFSAVRNMYKKEGKQWSDMHWSFRKAVFGFSLGGSPQVVQSHAAELIEQGVASVETEPTTANSVEAQPAESTGSKEKGFIRCRISEPLIIQASLNYFGLDEFTAEQLAAVLDDDVVKGIKFEDFLLPAILRRFRGPAAEQLQEDSFLSEYHVLGWSSYGVLATRCAKPTETIDWLNRSMDARFEGAVTPFCFPDKLFGPDLAFFVRTIAWKDFLLGATQAKLRNKLNEAEALRTLVPELFFCKNRALVSSRAPSSLTSQDDKKSWTETANKLFLREEDEVAVRIKRTRMTNPGEKRKIEKRTRSVLRVMVQYPDRKTKSANPGTAHASRYESAPGCKCDMLHDRLVTFDADNAASLFGPKGVELLRLVKAGEGVSS